ncbi:MULTISPECIES: hypothetical protein [Spongiactinospora]|uniref:hypothetical protein n=1 Tax=Spongiactinospora TaxID=2871671 RepID=UPI0011B93FDF|nr:hypothetical protein [Spongiactinospora gelatinilytica]
MREITQRHFCGMCGGSGTREVPRAVALKGTIQTAVVVESCTYCDSKGYIEYTATVRPLPENEDEPEQ